MPVTNVKVPVTTIFQNAREFSNLPVKISEKMAVKFLALPVKIFDKMPVKSQKVPVTKFKNLCVTGTLGVSRGKKHCFSPGGMDHRAALYLALLALDAI